MDIHLNPELLDRLAAAYALGTLRGGARRRFETLARHHPHVQAAALRWQQRLAGLAELQRDVAPPVQLWSRIRAQLQAERAWVSTPRPADPGQQRVSAWSAWRWSRWAGATAALLASLSWGLWSQDRHEQLARRFEQQTQTLAVLQQQHQDQTNSLDQARHTLASLREQAGSTVDQLTQARAEQTQQLRRLEGELREARAAARVAYLAVLHDDQADAVLLATYDERTHHLTLKRVNRYREAADRSMQLWSIAPGTRPQSLGVLRPGAIETWTAPPERLGEGRLLAISLEPLGGVPEAGGPTGPVLFKGAVLKAG